MTITLERWAQNIPDTTYVVPVGWSNRIYSGEHKAFRAFILALNSAVGMVKESNSSLDECPGQAVALSLIADLPFAAIQACHLGASEIVKLDFPTH